MVLKIYGADKRSQQLHFFPFFFLWKCQNFILIYLLWILRCASLRFSLWDFWFCGHKSDRKFAANSQTCKNCAINQEINGKVILFWEFKAVRLCALWWLCSSGKVSEWDVFRFYGRLCGWPVNLETDKWSHLLWYISL